MLPRRCRTCRRKAAEPAAAASNFARFVPPVHAKGHGIAKTADLLQERQRQGSGGTREASEGLPLSCTAIRNDALSDTASLQDLVKTVGIPERVPTTHLIDWLAELDSAGFLLCYLPTLLTMGHRTARDVVHKRLACTFAIPSFFYWESGEKGISQNCRYIEERPGGQTPQLAEQLFTDL